MLVKRTEEIVIYESPDGGNTVYQRVSGSTERTLVKQEPNKTDRWMMWRDILLATENDPALASVVEQAEIVYHLGRPDRT